MAKQPGEAGSAAPVRKRSWAFWAIIIIAAAFFAACCFFQLNNLFDWVEIRPF